MRSVLFTEKFAVNRKIQKFSWTSNELVRSVWIVRGSVLSASEVPLHLLVENFDS